MNNLGLVEPIEAEADNIEQQLGDKGTHTDVKPDPKAGDKKSRFLKSRYQTEEDRIAKEKLRDHGEAEREALPGHLWLFSTLFPLTAATLGPIANVMSICALVYPWRVYIAPGKNEGNAARIEDPKWALAINGISLASGVFANIILLLNLAKRISPTLAQPITIALWCLAFALLLILLFLYVTILRLYPRTEHASSQSFYYAIIAASLYFFIATLLTCNFAGALQGKYNRHFNLSVPQRTMMLQTMSLMMWICLGAGVFARIEEWTFLDAVHFCNVTLLTVGLGDYSLTTTLGRALLFPYAAIGVVTLGLVIGSIRGLVLERAKKKVKRRMLEKMRAKYVQEGNGCNSDGSNHDDRKEFEVMRKVQKEADQRRKWMSLGTSVMWVLVFWLLGGFVFMKAEHAQSWTYFQSVYFAFTSLLTIGYGDFAPSSNSGKPFFVIWSILAVPAMTILISNMGDTVIMWVKDTTLWIGEYTLLPERRGRERMEKRHHHNNKSDGAPDTTDQDVEKASATNDRSSGDKDEELRERGEALVAAEEAVEEEEQEEEEAEGSDGPDRKKQHEVMRVHHKLAMALQELLPDLASRPPKKYSYEKWRGYLDLMNKADEIGMHDRKKEKDGVDWGLDMVGGPEIKGAGKKEWMEEDSPLMAKGTEAEWLVKGIAVRLEGGLRRQIRNLR